MRRRSRQKGFFGLPTSFLDKLLILILVFITIAVLALILINPIVKKNDIETKAEYLIEMDWSKEKDHDVDIWIEDPLGNLLNYRNKEAGMLSLDRDDTGKQRDTWEIDGEIVQVKGNHETVAIRGIMAGVYVVNIHLFRAEDYTQTYVEIDKPIDIELTFTKVNPTAKKFFQVVLPLSHTKEERHVVSFEILADGTVIDIRTDVGYTLVYRKDKLGPAFFNDGSGLPFRAPGISATTEDGPGRGFTP